MSMVGTVRAANGINASSGSILPSLKAEGCGEYGWYC